MEGREGRGREKGGRGIVADEMSTSRLCQCQTDQTLIVVHSSCGQPIFLVRGEGQLIITGDGV